MKLISVVVPVYNAENTIEKCVKSITNQKYENLEIILVNDGSIDKSYEICCTLSKYDSRIVVVNKQNGGVSSARNMGIDKASGEYIVFIDSDDYIDEEYISTLICAGNKFNECDNIWCSINDKVDGLNDFEIIDKSKTIFLYNKCCLGSPCNKLYDLSVIKNNDIRMPEDLSLGEDLLFNLEYLDCNNGKIVFVNKALYYYYNSGSESLVNVYRSNLYEINNFLNDKLEEYMKSWNSPDEEYKSLSLKRFINTQDALYSELSPNNKKSLLSTFKTGNSILKSKSFQKDLTENKSSINKLIYIIYKCRSFALFYIISKFKR